MTKGVAGTLAALKFLAYGGPVAVAFAAGGSAILGVAMFGRGSDRLDTLVVLGAVGIVLGFVEWALARRFAAHELVESRQYDRVASIADSAAEQIGAFTKATREQTAAIDGFRAEVKAARGELDDLVKRVEDIEERFMRPAMLPGPRRTGGDGG